MPQDEFKKLCELDVVEQLLVAMLRVAREIEKRVSSLVAE